MTVMPNQSAAAARGEIARLRELSTYSPPGHSGTRNRRLVGPGFNGRFELVHGTLEPGGVAARHKHEVEAQVVYVLAGRARVSLGAAAPEECGPETVIRIPPGVEHEVVSLGPEALELLIVYSPPLGVGR